MKANRWKASIVRLLLAWYLAPLATVLAESQAPLATTQTCRCTCGESTVRVDEAKTRKDCQGNSGSGCNDGLQLVNCDLHFQSIPAPIPTIEPPSGFLCISGQTWENCIVANISVDILKISGDEGKGKDEGKVKINQAAERVSKSVASNSLSAAPSLSGASAKTSFLQQFQFASGLADFTDENGMLLFGFNTPVWSWFRLNLEVRPSRPEVFDKLAAAIPESERAAKVEAANKMLGEFDRIKYSLKLNFLGPRASDNQPMGSDDPTTFAQDLVYDKNGDFLDERVAATLKEANKAFHDLLKLKGPIPEISDPGRKEGEALIERAKLARGASDQEYLRYLNDVGFSRLGELLDQQPQFYLNGELIQQDELAGPSSSFKAGLVWEYGLGPSYNKFRKFLASCKAETSPGGPSSCFQEYLESSEVVKNRKWRMALKGEYGRDTEYDSPLEGIDLHLDEAQSWFASFILGGVLKFKEAAPDAAQVMAGGSTEIEGKGARVEQTRFDFEAKFEDVSGDLERQDRLNLTLTLSQRLNDDFSVEISAIWANKPQYRGEVDEEIGVLAGLRYKINRKE